MVLVYDNLVRILAPYRCHPILHTVKLLAHETQLTTFCLCNDNFGVKYLNREDTDHLLKAPGKSTWFTKSFDWSGKTLQINF